MLKEKLEYLSEKQKEISKLKKDLIAESAKIFDDFRKEFFIQNPKIESFSWTQYTPYFNDGDTCTFSVNSDYIKVNNDYVDECDWYNEKKVTSWGKWDQSLKQYVGRVEHDNPAYDHELSTGADLIKEFLGKFDDDFFMSKFGDHVSVIVSRDGIETEDYEHD